jgi:calcium homeostasis ER protein
MDTRIDNSNRGHQLMQKMGWSGAGGLGRAEQGMVNPIDATKDVRDKTEQYRGIGVRADPFEEFRKNRSKGYIQRIRTRDEMRECKLLFHSHKKLHFNLI